MILLLHQRVNYLCNTNAKNDLTTQSRKLQGDVSFSVNFFYIAEKCYFYISNIKEAPIGLHTE